MDETDDNISADDVSMINSPSFGKVKPKKRSLVERELETSLTARVTSPALNGDTGCTSRYGRARRLKTDPEYMDPERALNQHKSPVSEKTPVKVQSPVYKMHASNSPIKTEPKETPKKLITADSSLDHQIENIYHENISLSRFGSEEKKSKSPGAKFPKVYVRKDLIQNREKEDTVVLIKNMFSPVQSPYKSTNSHLNNILERSSEKYHLGSNKSSNGYLNTSSVVKTLDFDSAKKKKKENRDNKSLSKSDLFDMEAKCEYQVGDLAWARMGTYPFWPCIVTREPSSGMFVKRKLFGRMERDVIHVTFFGDNGRRGWIVDNMLRKFLGQLEFEATRERFSLADKKKDPRLYAAYFVSEKKMPQWSISVEEAETLLREPKRLRIDIFNDMLIKSRLTKSASKAQRSGKITRTASDVSLSESLYDTLFSEDDGKAEDPERSRNKMRTSLDVSEVVTACLDNMAAKTGITKIQRQSHMDRWLQKAKSKTPEKLQTKVTPQIKGKEVKVIRSKKKVSPIVPKQKPYSFRKHVHESQNLKSHHNEHDYSTKVKDTPENDSAVVVSIDVAKEESLPGNETVKENEEVKLVKDCDDIANENKMLIENDKQNESVSIAPIVSADDTVDEIQVNICSIEENAELENCLQAEQIVKCAVGEKKSKRIKKLSKRLIESIEMESEQHIATKEVDLNKKNKSLEGAELLTRSKNKVSKKKPNHTDIETVKPTEDEVVGKNKKSVQTKKKLDRVKRKQFDATPEEESEPSDIFKELITQLEDELHYSEKEVKHVNSNSVPQEMSLTELDPSKPYEDKVNSQDVENSSDVTTKVSDRDNRVLGSKKSLDMSQMDSEQTKNLEEPMKNNEFIKPKAIRKRIKRQIRRKQIPSVLEDHSPSKSVEKPVTRKRKRQHSDEESTEFAELVKESQIDSNKEQILLQSSEESSKKVVEVELENQEQESPVYSPLKNLEKPILTRKRSERKKKDSKAAAKDSIVDNNEKPVQSEEKTMQISIEHQSHDVSPEENLATIVITKKCTEDKKNDAKEFIKESQIDSKKQEVSLKPLQKNSDIERVPADEKPLDHSRQKNKLTLTRKRSREKKNDSKEVVKESQIDSNKKRTSLQSAEGQIDKENMQIDSHDENDQLTNISQQNVKEPLITEEICDKEVIKERQSDSINLLISEGNNNNEITQLDPDHSPQKPILIRRSSDEKKSDVKEIIKENQVAANNLDLGSEAAENIEEATIQVNIGNQKDQMHELSSLKIVDKPILTRRRRWRKHSEKKSEPEDILKESQNDSIKLGISSESVQAVKLLIAENREDESAIILENKKENLPVVSEEILKPTESSIYVILESENIQECSETYTEPIDDFLEANAKEIANSPVCSETYTEPMEDLSEVDVNETGQSEVETHIKQNVVALMSTDMMEISLSDHDYTLDIQTEKELESPSSKVVYLNHTITDPAQEKSKVTLFETTQSILEEDIEYGHLEFTKKRTVPEITAKENNQVNDIQMEPEENEYDHLDFIFSSIGEIRQNTNVKSDRNMNGFHVPKLLDTALDDTKLAVESRPKASEAINFEDSHNLPSNKDKSLVNAIKISHSNRELRVSVEKLPLSSLPASAFTGKQTAHHDIKIDATSDKVDKIPLEKIEEISTHVAIEEVKINGDHCDTIGMGDDEELDERLLLQEDSFEKIESTGCGTDKPNGDTEMYVNNHVPEKDMNNRLSSKDEVELLGNKDATSSNINLTPKIISEDCISHSVINKQEVVIEKTRDNAHENVDVIESRSGSSNCGFVVATVSEDDMSMNCSSTVNEHTTSIVANKNTEKTAENAETDKDTNCDMFLTSLNRLPEPVKLNGFHIDECLDFSDGEFNVETSSINSEDSEPLSVTRTKIISKNRNKAKAALEDPEFVKYLELRQDQVMDEHPELDQDEIVEYLYKTWQYEENAKSDAVKMDDIEQSGLVKGLNDNLKPKRSRNKLRDSKKRIKKRDEDSLSISSDISDASVKTRLRTRIAKSPASSIEDIEFSLSKEISLEIKTELLDNISVNSDVSYNSLKYTSNDNKLDIEPHIPESKEASVLNEDIQNSSSDKSISKSEDTKHTKVKEKTKSSKSKDNLVKSYFKNASSTSQGKSNPIEEDTSIDIPKKIKKEYDPDSVSINSEDSEVSQTKKRSRKDKNRSITDPEFLKYVELRQDPLIDENPQLTQDEIVGYLYKTWLYEESAKSDLKKTDDLEQASLVKGLNQAPTTPQQKRIKKKIKVEKDSTLDGEGTPKDKPKRKVSQHYYNEDVYDLEDSIELFEIFKPKKKLNLHSTTPDGKDIKSEDNDQDVIELDDGNEVDEVEVYFSQLVEPKPNVFKGLVREKVCEICEKTGHLVKCKGCNCMFHAECVRRENEVIEIPEVRTRGRKKKSKTVGRRPRNLEDSESHSDERSQDVSAELNASIEEEVESRTVNADDFEAVLTAKMQEVLPTLDANYDSYSSDDGLDWDSAPPGKCEIVDVKLKPKTITDYSNFKCNNCQIHPVPICFVCKEAVSKTGVDVRQRCQTAHCHKYYHMECLDHWPQTQFHSGDSSKSNKNANEHFETFMCPRHVCHTCVSDDPRGCRTRFSGDKLARCVKCPATYHSFTKCLPAGTKILTGSLIVCPRHYEHRPGKVPCHVNTGWCFICALGGSLICCEYCPTSFHAECLNIKPPEGGYMCEDCETGRLPLYGEMVWVKLGHYRWWPGIILHPCEIPENIMAVKHSPGEFVVRFFGQYDHYWVNRGRVFPFQEGDSGKISAHKTKIDAAFTTAMEHAQRACEVLKTATPNEEESIDIQSSLLPPHYVKLKVNKPCGSLCGRRVDAEEGSLTQCDCPPGEDDPCGPYSHCLNRMLLTECGPHCRAGERCSNRAFEKRLYPKMVPYRTPHRGWGLKTLEDIKAGQFVIEYVGELIDEEEFRRRMNRMHEIRDENFYFLTLDKERMIDAGPKGNLARFMNHCCEPNCETQKWTVLGDVRVGLFALYDIPANSELTFNYNLECAGIEKKRCMCGARRCSGYIGAKPKQEETQPKKNKLPGKRAYKKRKNVEESPSTSKNKPKRPVGRPAKPRELTEIEKDLLIIKNATNGISSDSEGSSRLSSVDGEKHPKALKRKRVSFSSEESSKRVKVDEKSQEVGD